MNMRCDTVRDLIPLCRDGIASAASRVIVEEHLKSCPACRNYYKAYIKSMKKNAQHAGITVTMKNPDGFAALSRGSAAAVRSTGGRSHGGIVFLLVRCSLTKNESKRRMTRFESEMMLRFSE